MMLQAATRKRSVMASGRGEIRPEALSLYIVQEL